MSQGQYRNNYMKKSRDAFALREGAECYGSGGGIGCSYRCYSCAGVIRYS